MQLGREWNQLQGVEKATDYFLDVWNIVDLQGLLLSAFVNFAIIIHRFGGDLCSMTLLRVLAAFASFFLLVKLYDWLRLFQNTAFYMELIKATLEDIGAFMILFVTAIFVFAAPMMILSLNVKAPEGEEDDSQGIILSISSFFMTQYLSAIGEYEYDSYDGRTLDKLCRLLFLVSTFFVQITMLNMLIAIMGDTYNYVSAKRETSATKTKLNLVSEKPITLTNFGWKE